MENFECNVCISTYKINKRNKKIECDKCNYITCNGCQKKYEKPFCMNCNSEFTKQQIEELLGKVFVKKYIINKTIFELIEKEKLLIPYTENHLKYSKLLESQKTLLRKGQNINIEMEKPNTVSININSKTKNCSKLNCNGTLKLNENNRLMCIVCSDEYCIKCLEIYKSVQDEEHICDKDTLLTLIDINNSTKECPKCYTLIYKIAGCDHMHCTYCNIHFDWNTGIILKISTNHHYRNNINNLIRGGIGENFGCDTPNIEPQIPYDILYDKFGEKYNNIFKILYDDCNKIREYYFKDISQIRNKYLEYNDELRVRFMDNKIKENNWGNLLYNNFKEYTQKQKEFEIISYYINFIDFLQSKLYNNEIEIDDSLNYIINLIKCCNDCFSKINDEFYCCNHKEPYKFTLPDEDIPIIMYKENKIKSPIVYNLKVIYKDSQTINLFNYQNQHYNNLKNILKYKPFFIDLSELGSGKTFTTCKYLQEHKFDCIFIVCPPSLRDKWQEVTDKYGIKCNIINYTEIAGLKGKQPKHGLLHRDDFTVQKKSKYGGIINCEISTYKPSKLLEDIKTKHNIIAIFDEIQYIKQDYSNITQATRTFIRYITDNSTSQKNKLILISGTPFDKDTQFITFFRNLGIQQSNELFLYDMSSRTNEPIGYHEILCYISNHIDDNDDKFQILIDAYNRGSLSKYTCIPFIKNIFINILLPIFSSKMMIKNDTDLISEIDVKNINTFYKFNNEDQIIIENGLKKCIDIISNIHDRNIIAKKRILIFKALQIIESSKINTLINEAIDTLDNIQNSKVILCVNYTQSIFELKEKLIKYNPIILDGKTTPSKRTKFIKLFQENNNNYRLIIGNTNIFCCGIDLDDKFGDFPRYVFVSPNFSTINLFQLSYRFIRSLDTKSSTIIRYIYSLNSIKNTMIDTLIESVNNSYTHPKYLKISSTIKNSLFKMKNSELDIFMTLSKKSDLMKSVANHGDSKYICNYDCEIKNR